jgi:hypothetical protein
MLPNMDRLKPCSLAEDDAWLAKAKRIELFQIYETAKTFSLEQGSGFEKAVEDHGNKL